jgi:ComF family protein
MPPVDRLLRPAFERFALRLLPPRCLACGERGRPGSDLCPDCHAELPRNRLACARCGLPMAVAADACGECLSRPPPYAASFTPFTYAFPVDRLLLRFKFHGDLACGQTLAELMHEAGTGVERPQALVPVPLHASRLRQRGYDQALELAKALGSAYGLPVLDRVLHRQRVTAPQSQLDAVARRRNLHGAFAVRAGWLPPHLALVDDVMTTGATLAEAAAALLRAGAKRVDAWAVARAV